MAIANLSSSPKTYKVPALFGAKVSFVVVNSVQRLSYGRMAGILCINALIHLSDERPVPTLRTRIWARAEKPETAGPPS